jgi:hypothetical protein
MRTITYTACAALLLLTGNAMAQTCPHPSNITQNAGDNGYTYSAKGGWVGDNPMGNHEDLQSMKFTGAKITDTSVICRYEAEELGGASLSIQARKQPTGDGWNSNRECTKSDVKACAFK